MRPKLLKHNTCYKVTPEQSKEVQLLAFSEGYQWVDKCNVVDYTDKEYLYILPNQLAFSEERLKEYQLLAIDELLFLAKLRKQQVYP